MAIFLITGASGTGKTTLAEQLSKYEAWSECVSHTTRPMRNGETNGKTYYFVSQQEFSEMQAENEFAEFVRYDGNRYGISHAEIKRVMDKSKHVYIIVEYGGYQQVKKLYPDAVGIFLYMSKEDCMANMLLRGDSIEKAIKRISTYNDEMMNRHDFDYVIKNVRNKKDQTSSILMGIIHQYS